MYAYKKTREYHSRKMTRSERDAHGKMRFKMDAPVLVIHKTHCLARSMRR